MRGTIASAWWVAAAAALVGCGDDGSGAGAGGEGGGPSGEVTYYQDVAPILNRSCVGCHQTGQIGGFALDTYETAKASAGVLAANAENGIMPPFDALETDECDPPGTWRDDPRLSDEEKQILRAWSDAGAPEGDPDNPAPSEPIPPPELDRVDLELTRDVPSSVSGDVDLFHCITFDPGFSEPTWVNGIHLDVDNPLVAHHAITNIVKRADAAPAGGEPSECFGGTSGIMVHAWVPGGKPIDMPDDVGVLVQPDEVLVVQMHYHPTGTTVEEDASSLQLRFAPAAPSWQLLVQLQGNASSAASGLLAGENDGGTPEFRVPANVEGHVEEMEYTVPQQVGPDGLPLFFIGGHMHYVGRDLKVTLSGAEDQCLLQIPEWDFNWQLLYQYDAPIDQLPRLHAGDKLRLRCTYDNTLGNPYLEKALEEQGLSMPVDVTLGESTLEEMCIVGLGVLVPVQ